MNLLSKFLSIICILNIVGCSPALQNPDAPVKPPVDIGKLKLINDGKPFTYSEFSNNCSNPSRRTAQKLFNKIIPEADLDLYCVNLVEADADLLRKDNSKFGSITTFSYYFEGINKETKFQNPSLTVSYMVSDDKGFSDVHNQNIVISGFRQKRELAMVKKSSSDAIAFLKTKEFGPELQYVVRAVDGPNNILAWIQFSDNLEDSKFSKDEMIARIQNLDAIDIFPLELVRYKVQEDLRDLDIKFDTITSKDTNFIKCDSCQDKQSVHVTLKASKEAPELKCVVLRPFIATTVQERVCSVDPNKEVGFCLSDQAAIPGERLVLSVQDINGNEIANHFFVPNPIIVKSSVDQVSFTAELLSDDCYSITAKNLNEPIMFQSNSGKELMQQLITESGDKWIMQYCPGVLGLNGGVGYVSFIRMSGEVLSMSLPWGIEIDRLIQKNQKILLTNKGF